MNKYFKLDDMFEIYSPPKRFNANSVKFGGKYPYVARGSSNNGIRGYITKDEKYLSPAKSLSFGQDTATVFYQPDAYFTGDKIKVMVLRNHELTSELAMYLISAISKAFSSFTWGQNSFNEIIIKSTRISLPVIENSNPNHEYTVDDIDWQYMRDRITELERDRITELERDRITELEAYLQATGLNDYELTEEDEKVLSEKVDVKSFSIGTVFEPLKVGFTGEGQKIGSATKEPDEEHCIPLTCAKIGDNGIMYWGKKGDFITYTNTLSVIADGAVSAGLVYAQPEETGAYSHSYFIDTKAKNVSKYAKTYLSSVLTKVIYPKYSREDAPRWNKIENDIIYLPITSDGEPDFDYMERYIRAMEKVVISDVVKYKDKVIETTKQIANE